MDVVAEVERLVETGASDELGPLLAGLTHDDRAAVGRWYRRKGRKLARSVASTPIDAGSRGVQLLLAAVLVETPEEAVQHGEWARSFLWGDERDAFPGVVEALARRGAPWCAAYVRAAADVRLAGDPDRAAGQIACLTLPLVEHYDLPVPDGALYARGWAFMVSWLHTFAKHRPARWAPLRPVRLRDGRAAYAVPLDGPLTLDAVLAATPKLHDTLVRVLATPDAAAPLTGLTGAGWSLPDALRRAASDGRVRRDGLIAEALAAATRSDAVAAQRATAQILGGLDLGPDDLRDRVPLVVGVLPAVHGSVTAALLPALLSVDLSAEDLYDVGATILARKEKAQKELLVRRLVSQAATGDEGAVAVLTMAAASEDRTLGTKASQALGGDASASSPRAVAAPTLTVKGRSADPFDPVEPSPAGLAQLFSDSVTWRRTTAEARWLDATVRFAARDRDGLRTAVAALPDSDPWLCPRSYILLRRWAGTDDPERSDAGTVAWRPYDKLTDQLVAETLRRMGRVAELLSTPSRADATLAFDELVARVARATHYAPHDLLQALLRLDATPVDRLASLDGLRLPAFRPDRPDGVDVIRAWVVAGGTPVRVAVAEGVDLGCPTVVIPPVLPEVTVIAPLASAIPARDGVPRTSYFEMHTALLGVLPSWVETLVTMAEKDGGLLSVDHTDQLGFVVGAPGPVGPAVHHHLARLLGHPRTDCRAIAAEGVLVLMTEGRFDPELFRDRSVALFDAGRLPLARTASAWEQVIHGGGLEQLWPTVHSVLDRACTAPRKPSGLAELLRTVRPYVGAGRLPDGVRTLAAARGSSKAHVEARALV